MSGLNYFKPAVSVVVTVAILTVAWFVFKARPTTTGRRTGPRVTNGRPVDPEQGHPERPPLRRSSERRSRFREELTSSDEDSETRGLLHVRVNNSDEDSEARSLITEDVNSSGEDSETRRLIPEDVNNSDEDLSTIAEESDSGSSGRPSDQRVIDAGLENTKCLYPGCTIRGLDAINCRHGDTSGNGGSEDGNSGNVRSENEGSNKERSKNEGSKNEGSKNEGSKDEGSKNEGSKTERLTTRVQQAKAPKAVVLSTRTPAANAASARSRASEPSPATITSENSHSRRPSD
ncbi:hypothetical protein C8034_v005477 [Colletotrichum sidae]|uniref:Uncharacterized protein n=1 Tax=Colletotrichum sidae TaxID=1347389 RepID=A0A4R8TTN0_9PEZI|nr:hypothetical protein C8034_v005477 [Colletotrichum sidae]